MQNYIVNKIISDIHWNITIEVKCDNFEDHTFLSKVNDSPYDIESLK